MRELCYRIPQYHSSIIFWNTRKSELIFNLWHRETRKCASQVGNSLAMASWPENKFWINWQHLSLNGTEICQEARFCHWNDSMGSWCIFVSGTFQKGQKVQTGMNSLFYRKHLYLVLINKTAKAPICSNLLSNFLPVVKYSK